MTFLVQSICPYPENNIKNIKIKNEIWLYNTVSVMGGGEGHNLFVLFLTNHCTSKPIKITLLSIELCD